MALPAAKNPNTTKHYIMAALTATLTVAVVITIVVVVLSPAHIFFSITDANYQLSSTTTDDDKGGMQLTLTVAANNTSRRTRVKFRSIFIDVSNSSGPQWENWARATVQTDISQRQATLNVTKIYAVVPSVGDQIWMDAIINGSSSFRVKITALARFRVGITWTRLYEIQVYCWPITFLPKESSKRSGGAHVAAPPPPIECGSGL